MQVKKKIELVKENRRVVESLAGIYSATLDTEIETFMKIMCSPNKRKLSLEDHQFEALL